MAAKQKKGLRGNFFAVEKRCFRKAMLLGLNEGLAYLVLACFSGPDNLTTSASVNAIENHAGVSRSKAKMALQNLIDHELLEKTSKGKRPKYKLRIYADIFESSEIPFEKLSQIEEKIVFEIIKKGKDVGRYAFTHVERLIKGEIINDERELSEKAEDVLMKWQEQEGTWLPKEIVMGTVKKETSPINLIRQMRDPLSLQMFVDAYDAQNLSEFGGIAPSILRELFGRNRVFSCAEYEIYIFASLGEREANNSHSFTSYHWENNLSPDEKDFWTRLKQFEVLGLIEPVPYLYESFDPMSEPIHVLGQGFAKKEGDELASLAYKAAKHLVPDHLFEELVEKYGSFYAVPVLRHISNVSVIGVYRMRYRARTNLSSLWWKKHMQNQEYFEKIYKSILDRPRPSF